MIGQGSVFRAGSPTLRRQARPPRPLVAPCLRAAMRSHASVAASAPLAALPPMSRGAPRTVRGDTNCRWLGRTFALAPRKRSAHAMVCRRTPLEIDARAPTRKPRRRHPLRRACTSSMAAATPIRRRGQPSPLQRQRSAPSRRLERRAGARLNDGTVVTKLCASGRAQAPRRRRLRRRHRWHCLSAICVLVYVSATLVARRRYLRVIMRHGRGARPPRFSRRAQSRACSRALGRAA